MAAGRGLLTAIGLVLVAGCTTSGPLPVPPRPTTTATPSPATTVFGADLLQDVAQGGGASYQIPVKTTEKIADGVTVVANVGVRPLTILGVEPVFQGQPRADVVLAIQLTHLKEHDEVMGVVRTYPPPGVQLIEVRGAIINPVSLSGDRFQIVLGLNVRSGTVAITGLRITFRVDGATYTTTLAHQIRLCAGRPPDATTC
jgi:hypothetical protein